MADHLATALSEFGDEICVRWLITTLHFLWQGTVVVSLPPSLEDSCGAHWLGPDTRCTDSAIRSAHLHGGHVLRGESACESGIEYSSTSVLPMYQPICRLAMAGLSDNDHGTWGNQGGQYVTQSQGSRYLAKRAITNAVTDDVSAAVVFRASSGRTCRSLDRAGLRGRRRRLSVRPSAALGWPSFASSYVAGDGCHVAPTYR